MANGKLRGCLRLGNFAKIRIKYHNFWIKQLNGWWHDNGTGSVQKKGNRITTLFWASNDGGNGSAWNGMGNVIFDFHTYLIGGAPI